jgi:hypothetical protein
MRTAANQMMTSIGVYFGEDAHYTEFALRVVSAKYFTGDPLH